MRTHTKTIITTLLATTTLALALAATAATARSFSASEREWEILFSRIEPLVFNAAGNVIRCPMTLLGHFFERTIPKAGQVGVIRHVEPREGAEPPCTGGTITILAETLPWRVNYVSFTGRLPAITSIRQSLIGIAFRLHPAGSSLGCLAGTTAREPLFGENLIGAGGGVQGLRADETARIRLGGGFLCEIAGESTFSGTATVLNLPQNASVTVTLI